MLKVNQIKCHIPHTQQDLLHAICRKCKCKPEQIRSYEILKHSIDARRKPELFDLYTVLVQAEQEQKLLQRCAGDRDISVAEQKEYHFPVSAEALRLAGFGHPERYDQRPVVIGSGPAGLFCALELAYAGLCPVVLERGMDVDRRLQAVEHFWESGELLPQSNVQFGEGGAGTFSDGKLNTLVKDPDGRNRHVLEQFVRYGGKENILYEQKPHLGTDQLKEIVKRMREDIQAHGGTFRFDTQVTDFRIGEGHLTGLQLNGAEEIPCRTAVLAIGHSARDTFRTLLDRQLVMEPKSFAVGYRVIHPQTFINHSQYGMPEAEGLGAAPYKVTAKAEDGRGVYSFCMCPGGYVVNASSVPAHTAVNGMSYSGRDGDCANSAIIVSVSPADYPDDGPLGGVAFQQALEKRAFEVGQGAVPIQKYGNFVKSMEKRGMILEKYQPQNDIAPFAPAIKGIFRETDLTSVMPQNLQLAWIQGMDQIGKHQIKGFSSAEVWVCGIESRTSSPVRIPRDETMQSSVRGLYPCGEGAGYAGGITSAAMDGIRAAEQIATDILKNRGTLHG